MVDKRKREIDIEQRGAEAELQDYQLNYNIFIELKRHDLEFVNTPIGVLFYSFCQSVFDHTDQR